MINSKSLNGAYGRLKELYTKPNLMRNKKFRMSCNPIKQAFTLAGTKDCVLKSTNVMYATLPSGNLTKVISIDDVTGITRETAVYTDRYMNTYIKQDIGLTTLRCGIMAALSADLNYHVTSDTKVGFIGNGNINQKTMEVLKCIFGIDSCVIRGSRKDRAKNKDKFESICSSVTVDSTESLEILNECDIVFCCTSSYKKEDMISKKELNGPNLLVVQDSGYIIDESFRSGFSRMNYTDHEEQLFEHYESEFPYDKTTRYILTMTDNRNLKIKKAVYLYGVAVADLIVFEEFFLEDMKC